MMNLYVPAYSNFWLKIKKLKEASAWPQQYQLSCCLYVARLCYFELLCAPAQVNP